MSWESVEEWPGKGGTVYRGAAEVIVAERAGLEPFERLRLWWQSTSDLPMSAVARDVVVTANYVYVRTRDGKMRRVRRELLRGGRLHRRRRIYAVPNDLDMVLSDRGGDEVEEALAGKDESLGWVQRSNWLILAIALPMIGIASVLSDEYLEPGARFIAAGRYFTESSYGFYAAILSWAAVAAFLFLFPRRFIVDGVGLRSERGLLRGVRSTIPVEDLRQIEVQKRRVSHKGGPVFILYPVVVHTDRRSIRIREFKSGKLSDAIDFAELCGRAWDVEVSSPKRPKSHKEMLEHLNEP